MVTDIAINRLGVELKIRTQIGEDLLAVSYLKWKDAGLIPVIFHTRPDLSLSEYLRWNADPSMEAVGCFATSIETGALDFQGIGWINQVRQFGSDRVAEVGVGFFRKVLPEAVAEYTEMLLDHAFQVRGFSAVYGISPVSNRAIHKFAKRFEFQSFGPLPKFTRWGDGASDAIMYAMTRERWLGRY